jgi:hypothetical protein
VSVSVPLVGLFTRPAALFRLFCAFAVAIVTTFHVCGTASARSVGPDPIVVDASNDAVPGDIDITSEQCHVCAVVSLPATEQGAAIPQLPHPVPVSASTILLSFCPSATSPPPRALA